MLTYPSEQYEFVSWDDDIPNVFSPLGGTGTQLGHKRLKNISQLR